MSNMPSAAALLKQYVQRNPSIRDCLRRNLINHSALAREVARSHRIKEIEALTMASSRYGSSLRSKPLPSESRYLTLLREARLHIQTRMLVAGVRRDRDYERPMALHALVKKRRGKLTFVDGHEVQTIITGIEFASDVRALFRKDLLLLIPDIVQVLLLATEKAVFTPGFSAFLLNRIALQEVNLIEELTSSGEHHFIVNEKDLPKVLKALQLNEAE